MSLFRCLTLSQMVASVTDDSVIELVASAKGVASAKAKGVGPAESKKTVIMFVNQSQVAVADVIHNLKYGTQCNGAFPQHHKTEL